MSDIFKTTPRTTLGVLLSSVSALALAAAFNGPNGPDNSGVSISAEAQNASTELTKPIDATLDDKNTAISTDKPPKTGRRSIPVTVYVGHPTEIKGWTAKHFQPWEFASKGNGLVKVDAGMVAALDAVREELGLPIRITSGYRDPAHNARVGGAKHSQHTYGTAVDIDLSAYNTETRYQLMRLLVKNGFTSFGSYTNSPSMLHADIRERAAKWHHGVGTHPNWFSRALKDAGWKLGATAQEMMGTTSALQSVPQVPADTFEKTATSRSVTVKASKSYEDTVKLEGQYKVSGLRGWDIAGNIAFHGKTDDLEIGATASYEKNGLSADVRATHNGDDTKFEISVTQKF